MTFEEAVAETVRSLDRAEARESLRRDPYWPKWDSPWWRMTLLWEMGLAERIPRSIVAAMTQALKSHFLNFFPLTDAEIPSGKEEFRHVICHCALGTMDQVLLACGVDLRREVEWTSGWYERYQLPDGGLNCTKEAYGASRKSSIVSTVPCLEAVLARAPKLTNEENAFLDRGAHYLIDHRLVRSSSGKIIDQDWLKPCFPRFYLYDVLRGARFLLRWGRLRERVIPDAALQDAAPWLKDGAITLENSIVDIASFVWNGSTWDRGRASRFALLEKVGKVGEPCPYLT